MSYTVNEIRPDFCELGSRIAGNYETNDIDYSPKNSYIYRVKKITEIQRFSPSCIDKNLPLYF